MVLTCCVPLCPSGERRRKGEKFGYHEIPADPSLRAQWVKVISRGDDKDKRKEWEPKERSRVCSLHFLDEDYQVSFRHREVGEPTGTVQRKLIKSAIPSQFPGYPKYKVPKPAWKRRKPPKKRVQPPPPRKKRRRNIEEVGQGGDGSCNEVSKENFVPDSSKADASSLSLGLHPRAVQQLLQSTSIQLEKVGSSNSKCPSPSPAAITTTTLKVPQPIEEYLSCDLCGTEEYSSRSLLSTEEQQLLHSLVTEKADVMAPLISSVCHSCSIAVCSVFSLEQRVRRMEAELRDKIQTLRNILRWKGDTTVKTEIKEEEDDVANLFCVHVQADEECEGTLEEDSENVELPILNDDEDQNMERIKIEEYNDMDGDSMNGEEEEGDDCLIQDTGNGSWNETELEENLLQINIRNNIFEVESEKGEEGLETCVSGRSDVENTTWKDENTEKTASIQSETEISPNSTCNNVNNRQTQARNEDVVMSLTNAVGPTTTTPQTFSTSTYPVIQQCPHCPITCYTTTYLFRHLRIVHEMKETECMECGEKFSTKEDRQSHEQTTHGTNQGFICKNCGDKFPYVGDLEAHAATHFGPKEPSPLPRKQKRIVQTIIRKDLEAHAATASRSGSGDPPPSRPSLHRQQSMEGQSIIRKFKITKPRLRKVEGTKTRSSVNVNLDASSKIKEPTVQTVCEICGKLLSASYSLSKHMNLVHGPKDVPCPKCKRKFSCEQYLRRHLRGHEEREKNRVKCHQCEEWFKSSTVLEEHERVTHGTYFCPQDQCTGVFKAKKALKKHIREVHGDRFTRCLLCGLVFPTVKEKITHLHTVHRNGEKYPCPKCDKAFSLSTTLKYHMATHETEKLFPCPKCDKKFRTMLNLKAHEQTVCNDNMEQILELRRKRRERRKKKRMENNLIRNNLAV